jgi:hypothetical protein
VQTGETQSVGQSRSSGINQNDQVSWLFLRLLALIYLSAFLSLFVQIDGLAGPGGILPFGQLLDHVHEQKGWLAYLRLPNIFWIDRSALMLESVALAGAFFSILLFLGRLERLSLIILFLSYLSLFHAGQTFLNFQWDYLLLETGFLSIFLVGGPSRLALFLFHWLLFRLRFLSGLSKLQSEDPSWSGLNALKYYFETQPLPHIGAWYAHHLPEWVLRFGTGFTLFAELIVPFLIFLPRRFRITAASITIALQLMIIATSNHNFFNLLTILLCLFLLDDRIVGRLLPGRFVPESGLPQKKSSPLLRLSAVIVMLSSAGMIMVQQGVKLPSYLEQPIHWVRAYGLGNVYHVFPTMQIERHELIIEGSHDGVQWQAYRFRHKPDWLDKTPAFIVPHQPRLDWMMWFVPTKIPVMLSWFDQLMQGLKENRPEVTGLLEENPFADAPPRYMRVLSYRYQFATLAEYERNGYWWKASYLGEFPYVPLRVP